MRSGKPLDDSDRAGWLTELNTLARQQKERGAVIACSALKESYREQLRAGLDGAEIWVYLSGSQEAILKRMQGRKGHFMPASLLESQFSTLEPPAYGIHVPVNLPVEQAVAHVLRHSG